jgi:hypothetical protein
MPWGCTSLRANGRSAICTASRPVVLHVRDGRITEAWAHHYDQHATDEFWA